VTAVEEWLPIPGWEGIAEISSAGRVRTITRTIRRSDGTSYTVQGMIRRQNVDHRRGGLRSVKLASGGRCQTVYVHLLLKLFDGDTHATEAA
jgi:hypothetical protein